MSFFGRDPKPPVSPSPSPAPAPSPAPQSPAEPKQSPAVTEATHIASGSKVVGRLAGNAELVVDGVVEGEIALDSRVVIGTDGKVKGEVRAKSVEVAGTVEGDIFGRDRVEVLASGKLEGDVVAPRVVIAEGAYFKGKVEMADPGGSQPKKGGGKPQGSGGGSQAADPSRVKPGNAKPGNPKPGGSQGPHKGQGHQGAKR